MDSKGGDNWCASKGERGWTYIIGGPILVLLLFARDIKPFTTCRSRLLAEWDELRPVNFIGDNDADGFWESVCKTLVIRDVTFTSQPLTCNLQEDGLFNNVPIFKDALDLLHLFLSIRSNYQISGGVLVY